MGIKDLYKVLGQHCPEQIMVYHLRELESLRVAVDISIFLYTYIRSAGEQRWMNTFLLFLCKLKKFKIKPVCIFDGPNPPVEKKLEQENRRAQRAKQVSRLSECIRIRKILQDKFLPFDEELTEELCEECKLLIVKKRGGVNKINYYEPSEVIDGLNETIDKLEMQTIAITDVHRDKAKELVRMMGFACLQADGEAEALCSYLAIHGKVDVVLTEDTDVMAYGTPFMIAFKKFKLSDEKVYGMYLPGILDQLEMNIDEFRDLCILLKCDYNHRVKGFPPDGKTHKKPVGIGVAGAWHMIREYRRLEEVSKYVVDITPLKYRRCRELFSCPAKTNAVPYNKEPAYHLLEKLIRENRLTIKVEYIKKWWEPPKIEYDTSCEESHEPSENDSDGSSISFEEEYDSSSE